MNENQTGILGYIDLPTGPKAIKPMNDMFIRYTFENKENWEILKLIANIFYEDYKIKVKDTTVELISGNIKVKTQFEYFKDASKIKSQDLEIESEDKVDFIEIQIKTSLKVPVEQRSMDYLGSLY